MEKISLSILIIGKICCGKSTLAKDFSKWLSCPIASFGGYLEKYSIGNGLPSNREALQNLGESMIEKDYTSFLNNVILHSTGAEYPSKLIFEGVRHKVVMDEIRERSDKMFSIYLDVSEEVRIDRFIKREKSIDARENAASDFYNRSKHKVEKELDLLKYDCNYVIVSNENYREFLQALSLGL